MNNVVVHAQPARVYLTPFQQWHFANDYLLAGDLFRQHVPHKGYSPVPYEMYCFAIELALKAFLMSQYCPENERWGHNLTVLLEKAKKEYGMRNYLELNKGQLDIVKSAEKMFRGGEKGGVVTNDGRTIQASYGYAIIEHLFKRKYLPLPDIDELQDIARVLVESTKEPCLHAQPKPNS